VSPVGPLGGPDRAHWASAGRRAPRAGRTGPGAAGGVGRAGHGALY